jgi:DNA-binding MarR family transcriptional regulator
MKLENAIKQKRAFRNNHHRVMVNLLYSNNWLEEKSRDFLKQQNISLQQYNILRILRGSGKPLSTMQIRERMLDRMSDTSRIIDRMVVKAIVEKKSNEAIVSGLSADEAKMLNDLLDKMRGG